MQAGPPLPKKSQFLCCIVGGGPAGMMLGFLLARAGVGVLILEKHADFLRDFRGDTVHASTLETIGELGLLEEFLKCPHQETTQVRPASAVTMCSWVICRTSERSAASWSACRSGIF